jgi:hypothetical protein
MEADNSLLSHLNGIALKYNHHQRKIEDKVILMVNKAVSVNALSRYLIEYGNNNIERRSLRMILTYKNIWQRENIYEINEHEEAVYNLNISLLNKDMISKDYNFNSIRVMLD